MCVYICIFIYFKLESQQSSREDGCLGKLPLWAAVPAEELCAVAAP